MIKMLHPQLKKNCRSLRQSVLLFSYVLVLLMCNSCGVVINYDVETKQEETRNKVWQALNEVDSLKEQMKEVDQMVADAAFFVLKINIKQFYEFAGRYPTTEEGLHILLEPVRIADIEIPQLLQKSQVMNLETKEIEYKYEFINSDEVLYVLTFYGFDKTFSTEDDIKYVVKKDNDN